VIQIIQIFVKKWLVLKNCYFSCFWIATYIYA
jgi:hypothetical protein